MKRDRQARRIGLTSARKVKRIGNKRYRGGADMNKGKKKRWWFEFICSLCGKVNKIEPRTKARCSCRKLSCSNNRLV